MWFFIFIFRSSKRATLWLFICYYYFLAFFFCTIVFWCQYSFRPLLLSNICLPFQFLQLSCFQWCYRGFENIPSKRVGEEEGEGEREREGVNRSSRPRIKKNTQDNWKQRNRRKNQKYEEIKKIKWKISEKLVKILNNDIKRKLV